MAARSARGDVRADGDDQWRDGGVCEAPRMASTALEPASGATRLTKAGPSANGRVVGNPARWAPTLTAGQVGEGLAGDDGLLLQAFSEAGLV